MMPTGPLGAGVSIHAPARGATRSSTKRTPGSARFNPRARTGRDEIQAPASRGSRRFQSTRPHGARPPAVAGCRPMPGFNPRARTGRDVYDKLVFEAQDVSIHAPARGATLHQLGRLAPRHVSIHAPARGATAVASSSVCAALSFQSTRPHGARPGRGGLPVQMPGFNPRARTGRDLAGGASCPDAWFQSTRPHGARHGQVRP